jgi:hypothetical protein
MHSHIFMSSQEVRLVAEGSFHSGFGIALEKFSLIGLKQFLLEPAIIEQGILCPSWFSEFPTH